MMNIDAMNGQSFMTLTGIDLRPYIGHYIELTNSQGHRSLARIIDDRSFTVKEACGTWVLEEPKVEWPKGLFEFEG